MAGETDQGANGIIINSSGSVLNDTTVGHIHIASDLASINYNDTDKFTFNNNVNVTGDITATGTITATNGIIGTSIGATTPSTGAFTTLTATGNITVGPEDAVDQGGQIEYLAPNDTITWVTEATGADEFTSSFHIRPEGIHTSGALILGGTTASNNQQAIEMYTTGTLRVSIDNVGIVKGLWSDTLGANANSQFQVVAALPATPDTDTIYFVVP